MSSSQNQNASTDSNPTETLRTAQYSIDSSSAAPESITASDIFASLDPAKLHPLAQLSDQLDFLNLEEDKTNELPGATTAVPSRGWGDDLCYGTGTTYLSGEQLLLHVVTSIWFGLGYLDCFSFTPYPL